MTDYKWFYVSSTIIREAAMLGGDISGLVPASGLAPPQREVPGQRRAVQEQIRASQPVFSPKIWAEKISISVSGLAPATGLQARFHAGLIQKSVAVPAVLGGHLGQEHPPGPWG